mgnify:CR=1 FL=1
MEELTYHVDFGPYYVHLTQKQKRYLAARSIIDRILAALALVLLSPLFLVVSIAQKSVHRMSRFSFYRSAWARERIASTSSSFGR